MSQRHPGLFYAYSKKHGRGVFTAKTINPGDVIEICPILEIPKKEVTAIHNTVPHDYYFLWGKKDNKGAIALGYGSLYNHSYTPNADFYYDLTEKTINFVCLKRIPAGKEIYINYHGEPNAKDEVWFDKSGTRTKRIDLRKK